MDALTPVITLHAVSALVVLLLGPFQILRRRRDRAHRILGGVWAAAMVVTCVSSFWIRDGGFSWLHGLSIWTLVCLVAAIVGIRSGSVEMHRGFMVGSYLGTLIAFAFAALVPVRLIPQLLRSEPLIVAVTVLAVAAALTVLVVTVVRSQPPTGTRNSLPPVPTSSV
ncbi:MULTISPECIES: DUF2306 domain-containing protein [Brachybacterium]|uniref:DUF2306 domain-containing protein n=1 Tax=Brachybacterium TaxID=43668 RepID=UPI0006B487C0|nr:MULTISPECIES: DUF2306 domain-containing protein [Brachybacterium]MCZ4325266.1 DUF2306 domain-containing protein [Brachybacterium paraconglomeratum]